MDKQKRNPDRDFIKVNQILGQQASIGFIPANQILPWIALTLIAYLLTNFFLSLGMPAFFLTAFWLVVSWWLLTGKRPHLFTDRFRRPPGHEWCNAGRLYVPLTASKRRELFGDSSHQVNNKSKLKPIIISKPRGKGRYKFMPFENEADICCLVEIQKKDRKVSGILLRKGQTYQVVFAFRVKGLHDILYSHEVSAAAQNLEAGFKELPKGEKLTLYCGCHSLDQDRQSELDLAAQNCRFPAISVLIRNEQKRIQELKRAGQRQEWEQILFCTWTANEKAQGQNRDALGKTIDWVTNRWSSFWGTLSGNNLTASEQFYTQLLLKAFESGMIHWEVLLSTKMNLQIRPLQTEEIWHWLWQRFNDTPAPDVPQVLRLVETRNGFKLQEEIRNEKHITSLLIQGEKGRTACPEHRSSPDRVYLTGKGKEVGVLTMFEPPPGWSSIRQQLRFVWDIMSNSYIKDTEAWIELTPGNKFVAIDNLRRISKQSKAARQRSVKKGQGRDVGAELKQQESFEAQARLLQGTKPLKVGAAFLVYRNNVEDLNNACSVLANSFGSAKVIRERNIAWEIWLQTLPITFKWLLHSSQSLSERRLTLDSTTVSGVVPLTIPRSIDNRGIEFISHRGGKPLYVDIMHSDTRRALLVGESGSGKSILGCRFAIEALAYNIPVVGMDISSGGESTFKTFIELLGDDGAYYDISSGSSNLMEPPDLRKFDKKERSRRKESWKESLRRALLAIAMGKIKAPHLQQRVDSILIRMLDVFLKDPEIIKRYNEAFTGGWKSDKWQQMPTLSDLLRFCSRERLNLKNFEDLDKAAINQIHSQISALLASRLGKAVSRPSTFSPNPAIKFFALSGLGNENDAYILAINAHAACMRNALSHPKSLFIGDELSVLFHKEGFANMVGELCATGRKDGISLCLITQDYDTICDASAGAQIMQNMTYKLSGRLTNAGVAAAQRYLNYPPAIISANATESFIPKRSGLYSTWLIEAGGRFWRSRYYPGEMTLACVANHNEEKAARQRVLVQYPNDLIGQLKGLQAFTQAYIPALKDGRGFKHLGRQQDFKNSRNKNFSHVA
ncbi:MULTISPECIES: hypothetical protein [unclassified Coleofasciculus]|uniref:hypothetical protein n=1 Tax=unclassified Coleofasciculus TaxID=2692782 RepID=UPI001882A721|nr:MULTISPECIES: hypothetical protein [unclassified Coleofasciculus]MBE9124733.1 hypothetical protein [Coleofasciculus sp. LEGE 07081]MBE9148185.1 hypothetical protein [Coleofasciculus sp. LEGE 07092]